MKKFIVYLFILSSMLIFNKTELIAQSVPDDPLYQLVFVEEFDSLGLDTSKWHTTWPWGPNIYNNNHIISCFGSGFPNDTVDIAFNRDQWGGGTNRAFDTVGSGFQRIISRRENFNAPIWTYDANGNYTGTQNIPFEFSTAMLYGKNNFKYGYFEFRYRTSAFAGHPSNAYGPNWWMWAGSSNGVEYSEIDIFEMSGVNWRKNLNIHFRRIRPTVNYSGPQFDTTFFHALSESSAGNPAPYTHPNSDEEVPGNWQTVGCDWNPNYIDVFYSSNDTFHRYTDTKIYVSQLGPMPFIIDTYTPAFQACIPFVDGVTQMPFNYDIDYVKAWQIRQNCIPQSILNTSSATYVSTLWQSLVIGGVSGSATFSTGNHHLAAQDFVTLQEGFEASGANTTVTISTKSCQVGQTAFKKAFTNPPAMNEALMHDLRERYE